MTTNAEGFATALGRIEVPEPRKRMAREAHTEVRALLESDLRLRSWGVDTVLIGSYARHTGICPGKDVDVFAKMTALDTSIRPDAVFNVLAEILEATYGDRASRQARSVKITFGTGASEICVDAVPAVRSGERWAIPSKIVADWAQDNAGKRWVVTDPERLSLLTEARNKAPLVSGQGAYVPTVKLVRQTREYHLGGEKPGGLYFELLTYWAFVAGVGGTTFAEIFARTLDAIQLALASDAPLIDPALGTPFAPAPTEDERRGAAALFARLAADAEAAFRDADECRAAAAWRKLLGQNELGAVFPLPDGCDERGERVPSAVRVMTGGHPGASPFA